jgi:hypothetical protein
MFSDVAVAIEQHDQMRPRVELKADFYQAVFSSEGYALEEALARALVESGAQTVTQAPVILRLPRAEAGNSEKQHQDRASMPLLDAVDDLLSDLSEEEWDQLPFDMASSVDERLYSRSR